MLEWLQQLLSGMGGTGSASPNAPPTQMPDMTGGQSWNDFSMDPGAQAAQPIPPKLGEPPDRWAALKAALADMGKQPPKPPMPGTNINAAPLAQHPYQQGSTSSLGALANLLAILMMSQRGGGGQQPFALGQGMPGATPPPPPQGLPGFGAAPPGGPFG